MVFINEWFPNPVGPDNPGEFIELYNSGAAPVNLNGWSLKTEKGKIFSFKIDTIAAGGYLVLKHGDTKLMLRNMDGGLALYNGQGVLVDRESFAGTAPQGKSFSRVNYVAANIAHFAFVDPTPGVKNVTIENTITSEQYPAGISLVTPLKPGNFFVIMVGTTFVLVGLILYCIHANEDIAQFFFEGDRGVRRESG